MIKAKTGLELIRFIRDENLKMKNKVSYVSFRYYVGVGFPSSAGRGVRDKKVFRFVKGGDLKNWAEVTKDFTRVYGPFNTLTAASIF